MGSFWKGMRKLAPSDPKLGVLDWTITREDLETALSASGDLSGPIDIARMKRGLGKYCKGWSAQIIDQSEVRLSFRKT